MDGKASSSMVLIFGGRFLKNLVDTMPQQKRQCIVPNCTSTIEEIAFHRSASTVCAVHKRKRSNCGCAGEPPSLKFFAFPRSDLELRRVWLELVGLDPNYLPSAKECVCSRHFDVKGQQKVPTLGLPIAREEVLKILDEEAKRKIFERARCRERTKIQLGLAANQFSSMAAFGEEETDGHQNGEFVITGNDQLDSQRCQAIDCETAFNEMPFYPIPDHKRVRWIWLYNIAKRGWAPPKRVGRVCARHFVDGHPTAANPFPILGMGGDHSVITGKAYRWIVGPPDRLETATTAMTKVFCSISTNPAESDSSVRCCISGCDSTSYAVVSFPAFHEWPVANSLWRMLCGLISEPAGDNYVCASHFEGVRFNGSAELKIVDVRYPFPTIRLFRPSSETLTVARRYSEFLEILANDDYALLIKELKTFMAAFLDESNCWNEVVTNVNISLDPVLIGESLHNGFCLVKNCKNRSPSSASGNDAVVYALPSSSRRFMRSVWLFLCDRSADDAVEGAAGICHLHFRGRGPLGSTHQYPTEKLGPKFPTVASIVDAITGLAAACEVSDETLSKSDVESEKYCIIDGCVNRLSAVGTGSTLCLRDLPCLDSVKRLWLQLCGLPWDVQLVPNLEGICSDHFRGDYPVAKLKLDPSQSDSVDVVLRMFFRNQFVQTDAGNFSQCYCNAEAGVYGKCCNGPSEQRSTYCAVVGCPNSLDAAYDSGHRSHNRLHKFPVVNNERRTWEVFARPTAKPFWSRQLEDRICDLHFPFDPKAGGYVTSYYSVPSQRPKTWCDAWRTRRKLEVQFGMKTLLAEGKHLVCPLAMSKTDGDQFSFFTGLSSEAFAVAAKGLMKIFGRQCPKVSRIAINSKKVSVEKRLYQFSGRLEWPEGGLFLALVVLRHSFSKPWMVSTFGATKTFAFDCMKVFIPTLLFDVFSPLIVWPTSTTVPIGFQLPRQLENRLIKNCSDVFGVLDFITCETIPMRYAMRSWKASFVVIYNLHGAIVYQSEFFWWKSKVRCPFSIRLKVFQRLIRRIYEDDLAFSLEAERPRILLTTKWRADEHWLWNLDASDEQTNVFRKFVVDAFEGRLKNSFSLFRLPKWTYWDCANMEEVVTVCCALVNLMPPVDWKRLDPASAGCDGF